MFNNINNYYICFDFIFANNPIEETENTPIIENPIVHIAFGVFINPIK